MQKSHHIDATPTKKSYLAIVSDYDINTAICELIDNSIDGWSASNRNPLKIKILFDLKKQTIQIEDNAGGLAVQNLNLLVQPGASSNSGDGKTIGIFGVGSKRAVISLAKKISITTRVAGHPAYEVLYDQEWLEDEGNWDVPCYEVLDKCAEGQTVVKLHDLRHPFDDSIIDTLKIYLSRTYGILIGNQLQITIGPTTLEPLTFDSWAFPMGSEPLHFYGTIKTPDAMSVDFSVKGGLLNKSEWATDDWGVFFYCNDRLIASGIKGAEVGFVTGQAGVPHYSHSVARVVVNLKGPAKWMPWNSNKTNINFSHEVFRFLKRPIVDTMTRFARISKTHAQNWETEVFSVQQGNIRSFEISDSLNIKTLPLPALPPPKPNYFTELRQLNGELLVSDPWKGSLIDGIQVLQSISKQKFVYKNWFIMVLLDSVLTLALCRYTGQVYGQKQVEGVDSQNLLKTLDRLGLLSNETIAELCSLRAAKIRILSGSQEFSINDEDVRKYRRAIQEMLLSLFLIKFPEDT